MAHNLSFDGHPQTNPFADEKYHPKPVKPESLGKPNLKARELLDLPLPDIAILKKDGKPSESSENNRLFWSPEHLLYEQYESCFGKDLGGYPDNIIDNQHRFFPFNEVTDGPIITENHARAAARKYICGPVNSILHHKIKGNKYHVEYGISGGVPPEGRDANLKVTGDIDAAWTVNDEPYAFCEMKRVGVLRDEFWMNGELTGEAICVMLQVLKYAWVLNKLFWIVCTWDRALFIKIPQELALETFTKHWRSKDVPPELKNMPGVKEIETTEGRHGKKPAVPGESAWPIGPIQAVMSKHPEFLKIQFMAFIYQSYLGKGLARQPVASRAAPR